MLFPGWEVDRPKPVNNIFIFFLLRLLGTPVVQKFEENFPSLSNPCVLKQDAFLLMKRAIDCKPKQNIAT